MKKTILPIFVASVFFSFFGLISFADGYVYNQPWVCDENFNGHSADWWCGSQDNCTREDYDFCIDNGGGERSVHFGCKETGLFGANCVCNEAETSYEDCSGDCENGLCTTTRLCDNLGGVCCPIGKECIGNHDINIATDCTQCCDDIDYCRVVEKTCAELKGECCFPGQVCTSGEITAATDCDECCGDASDCIAQTCSHLGGTCCDSGYECTKGVVSDASDCDECCLDRANCRIITGTCSGLGGKCCPSGQTCPYYSKISGATDCNECCKGLAFCSVSEPKTCTASGGVCCSSGEVCTSGKIEATNCNECCNNGVDCRVPLETCTDAGGECCSSGETCTEGKLAAKDCECCGDTDNCEVVTLACTDLGGKCCSSGQTCIIGEITEAEDCECCSVLSNCSGSGNGGGGGAVINNPLDIDTVVELINRILDFIWKLAIVFAPVMLLVGGFYIMTAGGNPTNFEKGKKIMIYTIIGFAIVLLSRGIVALVKDIIGVEEDLSFLQFEDTLKLFCFSGIIGIKKTFFKRSANK